MTGSRDVIINIGAKANNSQISQQVNLVINQINRINTASQKSGSLFANIFGGNVASRAVLETLGLVKNLASEISDLTIESIKLSANFQDTTNAFAVFAGSAGQAKRELQGIAEAARNTAGLRL